MTHRLLFGKYSIRWGTGLTHCRRSKVPRQAEKDPVGACSYRAGVEVTADDTACGHHAVVPKGELIREIKIVSAQPGAIAGREGVFKNHGDVRRERCIGDGIGVIYDWLLGTDQNRAETKGARYTLV